MYALQCRETDYYFCGSGYYMLGDLGTPTSWLETFETARLYRTERNAKIARTHVSKDESWGTFNREYHRLNGLPSNDRYQQAHEARNKRTQEIKESIAIIEVMVQF